MPAKALLIAEAGDADDHRVGILAVREEAQRRRLAADLVLGIVDVGEELDLGDREQVVMGGADAEAEDALLVEQGVDHPRRAEALVQLGGDVVDAALGPDILAGDDDIVVRQHQIGERPAQQPRHMLRLVHHARGRARTGPCAPPASACWRGPGRASAARCSPSPRALVVSFGRVIACSPIRASVASVSL